MSVNFSISNLGNKYLPKDTFNVFSTISSFSEENNFFYLFNFPKIINWKIRINEDIQRFKWDQNFLKQITTRKDKMIEKLQKSGFNCKSISAFCPWRLVIGLGASHPQETSMTLHHIYGIPYIPGSAVKGITRHWAVLKFAEEKTKIENKSFKDSIDEVAKALDTGNDLGFSLDNIDFKKVIEIFGTQKQAGKVIFMDAYPVNNINLKIDIMNVHYPEYYSGDKPPADWQNPDLIKFLTVEKTKFQFCLLSRENNLLNIAERLLKEALKEHGIGAKTALGYGIFET
ncbi:MAG: type III-B CRISPR module RAMP protein Cmr6 [candidate division WOR-3 bacterium]